MFVSGTLRRPAYRLYQLAWAGLDWLYPPRCGGCGLPGSRWCSHCQHAVREIAGPLCQHCGLPQPNTGLCQGCAQSPPPYVALRSWAAYGGVLRQAIRRLKYHGDMSLGEILAQPLAALLRSLAWPIDCVVPVPVSQSRRRERGYNQATLLALPLALGSDLAFCPKALSKVRETRTQVGLDARQRQENVHQAFAASHQLVQGKKVLVVDDVATTGATMNTCAQALLQAGALQVYGITLARAGPEQDVALDKM